MKFPKLPQRKGPRRLRVWSHNVKVGRRPRSVAAALRRRLRNTPRRHHPHLIFLQEAQDYHAALRNIPGYDVHAATGWPEAGTNVVLARNGLPVQVDHKRLSRSWTGPKHGLPHVGRTYPVVRVGSRWLLIPTHRIPGGPRGYGRADNQAAWAEEDEWLAVMAAVASDEGRAFASLGDQNDEFAGRDKLSVRSLARRIGGRQVGTGAAVDHGVTAGCVGEGHRHENDGSDHPLTTYVLTHDRKES